MIKLKALGKKVLVEVASPEKVTKSGIIMPATKDDRSNKGIVVSVGEEVKGINITDTVYFNKFTGAEIEHEGYKYLVLKVEDIHLVIL